MYTPMYKIKSILKVWRIISESDFLKAYETDFKYHNVILMNYYKPAVNFHEIEKLIDYKLTKYRII